MFRRPPSATRTDTLFPSTTLFRSIETAEAAPSLDALARRAGLSPHHFHRVFKAGTGLTPKAYAVAHRARRVRTRLDGAASITDAIYDAGDRKSTSELQSLMRISYAVLCLKKKKKANQHIEQNQ